MLNLMQKGWFSYVAVFLLALLAIAAIEFIPEGFLQGLALGTILGVAYGFGYLEGRVKEMDHSFEQNKKLIEDCFRKRMQTIREAYGMEPKQPWPLDKEMDLSSIEREES